MIARALGDMLFPVKWAAVARLAALVTCVGLATSRLGLLAHELVGHGGAAVAMGGQVTAVRLFWFAGGWVRYEGVTHGQLFVSMGGIAVELVVGALITLILVRRGSSLAVRVGRCVGAALVIHAAWYLATGTFHGYGDGLRLHRELGGARVLVWVPAALLAVGVSFLAARSVLGAFAHVGGGRTGTAIALVVGLGAQLGAMMVEVRVRRDESYTRMMTHENTRVADREYAAWLAAQQKGGAVPDDAQREHQQQALAAAHRDFPFAYVLALLLIAAVIVGALRARPAQDAMLTSRLLGSVAAIALGSIAVVIAIGALLS
ncbi:hypothetical protein BH11MYX2_BH11MYX2_17770 [soil metagenome]